MKRKNIELSSPNEPLDELLVQIGRNGLSLLNEIPLNCKLWVPLQAKLTNRIDPIELAP